jgi:decaprenyl-phosphate phosphoribosyltransferase
MGLTDAASVKQTAQQSPPVQGAPRSAPPAPVAEGDWAGGLPEYAGGADYVAAVGARRKKTALALVQACRPKQWSKNLLVLAAPAAAGVLFDPEVPGRVALAFVSFCLLSSATYLFNDVHDRAEDARHDEKRSRAIAAGRVSVGLALSTATVLAVLGLGIAAVVRPALAGVGAAYLALTATYTLWLRHLAVADIAAVAAGFVLRALAGGVAVGVPLSRWFLIVTSFGALFLVAGKRYAELPGAHHATVRAPLREYSPAYLRFVMVLAAAVAVGAYCLWAFQRRRHGVSPWYDLTILPFVLWLLRYALLVDQGAGQAPEELALRDRFLLSMSVAWAAIFAGAVYVGT